MFSFYVVVVIIVAVYVCLSVGVASGVIFICVLVYWAVDLLPLVLFWLSLLHSKQWCGFR